MEAVRSGLMEENGSLRAEIARLKAECSLSGADGDSKERPHVGEWQPYGRICQVAD